MSGRHLGIFFGQCVLVFSGKMSERHVQMSWRHLGIFQGKCLSDMFTCLGDIVFFFYGQDAWETFWNLWETSCFFPARCLRGMLRCPRDTWKCLSDSLAFFSGKMFACHVKMSGKHVKMIERHLGFCSGKMSGGHVKMSGRHVKMYERHFLIFWRFNISVNLVNVSLKKSSLLLLFLQTLKTFLTQFPTQFISTCHSRNLYLWRCLEITFQKHKTFFDKMFHQGVHLSLSQFSSCRSAMFSFDSWAVLLTPSICVC